VEWFAVKFILCKYFPFLPQNYAIVSANENLMHFYKRVILGEVRNRFSRHLIFFIYEAYAAILDNRNFSYLSQKFIYLSKQE